MATLGLVATHLLRLSAGVAGGYAFYRYGCSIPVTQLSSIASLLATICSTLLGFVITAIALITAIMDRTLIANMQKTGHYQVLMKGAFVTCVLLFLSTISCVADLFLPERLIRAGITFSVFACVASFIYLFETGRRFAIVVFSLK